MGLKDPTMENYLAHYGVLGMKWGVRRSQSQLDRAAGRQARKQKRDAPNPKYTRSMQKTDKDIYGSRATKRINRRVNKGKSVNQARLMEIGRQAVIAGVATAAFQIAFVDIASGGEVRRRVGAKLHGPLSKAAKAHAAREAGKRAANQLLDKDYISSLKPIKLRRGRYKITDL